CAKAIKHTFNRNQDSPQSVGRLWIVFAMRYIGIEPDWVWYLDGHCPNPNIYVHPAECGHKQLIEVADRARLKSDCFPRAVGSVNHTLVRYEIKGYCEGAITVGHQRRCQPTRRHLQSDIPVMIYRRRECEGNLANDLRPHV